MLFNYHNGCNCSGFVLLVTTLALVLVEAQKIISSSDKNEELLPRIVNGTNARNGEHPWAIAFLWKSKFACMSFLISKRTTLTAGHCFDEREDKSKWMGRIGDIKIMRGKIVYFSKIKVHPRYMLGDEINDIGLVILTEDIEFNDRIKPIPLPRVDRTYHGSAYVPGWGRIVSDKKIYPVGLQVVEVDLLPPSECVDDDGQPIDEPLGIETFICATSANKGTAKGDSGAPLIRGDGRSRMSIGVEIGNVKPKVVGRKMLFASTGYHAKWIRENAKGSVTFI